MSRIQKILAGIFLTGVLLGGIGTGVALAESSSFTYVGKKQLGAENLITKTLDFTYDAKKGALVLAPFYWENNPPGSKIQTDNRVPSGTVRYIVTYNKETVEPVLLFHKYETQETMEMSPEAAAEFTTENPQASAQGYLELYPNYIGDSFALFMETKDQFLSEFRQKKISNYDVLYITDVKIKINPADMEQITD